MENVGRIMVSNGRDGQWWTWSWSRREEEVALKAKVGVLRLLLSEWVEQGFRFSTSIIAVVVVFVAGKLRNWEIDNFSCLFMILFNVRPSLSAFHMCSLWMAASLGLGPPKLIVEQRGLHIAQGWSKEWPKHHNGRWCDGMRMWYWLCWWEAN